MKVVKSQVMITLHQDNLAIRFKLSSRHVVSIYKRTMLQWARPALRSVNKGAWPSLRMYHGCAKIRQWDETWALICHTYRPRLQFATHVVVISRLHLNSHCESYLDHISWFRKSQCYILMNFKVHEHVNRNNSSNWSESSWAGKLLLESKAYQVKVSRVYIVHVGAFKHLNGSFIPTTTIRDMRY